MPEFEHNITLSYIETFIEKAKECDDDEQSLSYLDEAFDLAFSHHEQALRFHNLLQSYRNWKAFQEQDNDE